MDIDRARELNDYDLLRREDSIPDADEETTCDICGKAMLYTGDEWVTEAVYDRSDDCWTGDSLLDAVSDERGTLCSRPCISQAMYNALNTEDKRKLNLVLDACRTIAEFGERVGAIVHSNRGMSYSSCLMTTLIRESNYFISDVCDGENAWTERNTLLELSQSAMRDAADKAERLARELGDMAVRRISGGYSYDASRYAQPSGTAAHIYLDLKEALSE